MVRHEYHIAPRIAFLLSALSAALFLLAAPAYAQGGYGLRAGVSADPDQFFVGGHLETPGLDDRGQMTFRPNVEIGFSSTTKTVAGNMEVCYWMAVPKTEWYLYVGAGPAAVWVHNNFESRAHGAFNGLVGFQNSGGLFVELKTGRSDAGSLKLVVGYAFKQGSRHAASATGN